MELVKNSCCPTQVLDISTCTWDLDTGTLMTCQEAAEEKNRVNLESVLWFQDAFAKLGTLVNEKLKKQALPPNTLFNLNEDRSLKTIPHFHEQAVTTMGSTPPWKGKGEIVNLANLDEDSASLSSIDRPCTVDPPTSSDEEDGDASGILWIGGGKGGKVLLGPRNNFWRDMFFPKNWQ